MKTRALELNFLQDSLVQLQAVLATKIKVGFPADIAAYECLFCHLNKR